jgi:uncharacterized protein (DUF2141 family)
MVKMRKIALVCVGAALLPVNGAQAASLGPDSGVCAAGNNPAILVKVIGLKDRAGTVRARTFGGNPGNYFDKRFALKRTEVATPASGTVEICMPVPKPGRYAVDIRHDANSNGSSDKADGAGTSGNPQVSLFDILFKRRPPANKVEVSVGNGVVVVPIVVNYIQGGSLKPITSSAR